MFKKLLVKPNQKAHTDRGAGRKGKGFSEMKKLDGLRTPKMQLPKIGRVAVVVGVGEGRWL